MRLINFCAVTLFLWTSLFAQTDPAGIPSGYYDQTEGLTGSELKAKLHAIISDHVKYPYTSSSTDVWDILKESDEDPSNPNNVILLYTGRSQAKSENSGESSTPGSNRWNREHVWSKSHGFPVEQDTAFTDCHHIRPADESVNSSRNTLDFDNGGDQHAEADQCYYDSDSWEPRDAIKGDVARMMFYMVVRYDPGYHMDNTVYDLELVDLTGTQTYTPVFGKLSTLLNWHKADPVDAFESNRNEVVYQYQGNRNPFIDHPEWVDLVFAQQLGTKTQVGFTDTDQLVEEDAGTVTLQLSILNPDPLVATSCDVALIGGTGDASDLDGFTSTEIVFPAGTDDFVDIEIPITDDSEPEGTETFILSIQNITGGDSAFVNGSDKFILTINPSDIQSAASGIILSEIMDGNRSGGQPKFVEITNTSLEEMDISGFEVWRGSNGGEPVAAATIPNGTQLEAGKSWVIAYNEAGMTDAGFNTPDQIASSINGNGNDSYQLRNSEGEIIDVFGTPGTTASWYENSCVWRLPEVNTGQGVYQEDEWSVMLLESGFPSGGSPGTPGTHTFIPTVSVVGEPQPVKRMDLIKTYPNPFNASTTIQFNWASGSRPEVHIYDTRGVLVHEISNSDLSPGSIEVRWNGQDNRSNDLPSGIYFLRVKANQLQFTQKITLIR